MTAAFPSVTAILSPWTDFSNVPDARLAAAADRGTRVHAACLAEVRGLWVLPDPEVEPYIESFRRWLPRIAKVISAEAEYVDEDLGYKGHPDLVVIFQGDVYAALPDIKTPRQKNPLWRVQTAAYKNLVEKALGIPVKRTGSLRLSPEGRAPIFAEYTGSLAVDFAGFLAAKDAYQYFQKLRGRLI
jgi:hypothetical protein